MDINPIRPPKRMRTQEADERPFSVEKKHNGNESNLKDKPRRRALRLSQKYENQKYHPIIPVGVFIWKR